MFCEFEFVFVFVVVVLVGDCVLVLDWVAVREGVTD